LSGTYSLLVVNRFATPTPAFAQAMSIETDASPRVTPADAFNRAREIVHAGDRLDMLALASELGIARATLYRWTGDRERLLSDICWSDVDALLDHVVRTTAERGIARVEAIATRFLQLLTTGDRLPTLLRTEGETAFRLVTDSRGGVRPRLVEAVAAFIQQEVDEGFYRPPAPPHLLAEGIITVGERFLYHGGNPQANPDPDNASRIIMLLMREPPA
jgi:AcrR family transcriptional regulator